MGPPRGAMGGGAAAAAAAGPPGAAGRKCETVQGAGHAGGRGGGGGAGEGRAAPPGPAAGQSPRERLRAQMQASGPQAPPAQAGAGGARGGPAGAGPGNKGRSTSPERAGWGAGAPSAGSPLGGQGRRPPRRAMASGPLSTGMTSNLEVKLNEVDAPVRDMLAQEDLKAWVRTHDGEMEMFNSAVLYAEVRLQETLQATAALATPNVVRTNEVCNLLLALAQRAGPFKPILQRLGQDLEEAVYDNPGSKGRVPYFYLFNHMRGEHDALKQASKRMEGSLEQKERLLMSRSVYCTRVIERMFQTNLRNTFQQWRQGAEATKEARDRVYRVILKWKQMGLLRAFNEWRQGVSVSRENRMLTRITELKQACLEVQEKVQKYMDNDKVMSARCSTLTTDLEVEKGRTRRLAKEIDLLRESAVGGRQSDMDKKKDKKLESTLKILISSLKLLSQALRQQCEAAARQEPDQLLHTTETRATLEDLPVGELVLRWANFHLDGARRPEVTSLKDLTRGDGLAHIMCACSEGEASVRNSGELSTLETAQAAVSDAREYFGLRHGVVRAEDIAGGSEQAVLALLSQVMSASPSLDGDFAGGTHFMAAREELRVLDEAVLKLQEYLWGGAEQEEGIRVPTHGKLEELEALATAATLKGAEVLQKGEEAKVLVQALGARAQAHVSAGLLAWAKGDEEGALVASGLTKPGQKDSFMLGENFVRDQLKEKDGWKQARDQIDKVLGKYMSDLKRVFKIYAPHGDMSLLEFWRLVTDTRVLHRDNFVTRFEVNNIFLKATAALGETIKSSTWVVGFNCGMNPRQFLESLVLIAWKIEAHKGGRPFAAEPLWENLEKIVKHGTKAPQKEFRQNIISNEKVQGILAAHWSNLRQIFCQAARSGGGVLGYERFDDLMTEAQLLDPLGSEDSAPTGVSRNDVKDAVRHVLGEADVLGTEMVFPEFIQVLLVLVLVKYPSPFNTLARRVEAFLTDDLEQPLQTRYKILPTI